MSTPTTYDPMPELVQLREITDDPIPQGHIDAAIRALTNGEPLYRIRQRLKDARAVQRHLENRDGAAAMDLAFKALGGV